MRNTRPAIEISMEENTQKPVIINNVAMIYTEAQTSNVVNHNYLSYSLSVNYSAAQGEKASSMAPSYYLCCFRLYDYFVIHTYFSGAQLTEVEKAHTE